jgi:hypothetical protein
MGRDVLATVKKMGNPAVLKKQNKQIRKRVDVRVKWTDETQDRDPWRIL